MFRRTPYMANAQGIGFRRGKLAPHTHTATLVESVLYSYVRNMRIRDARANMHYIGREQDWCVSTPGVASATGVSVLSVLCLEKAEAAACMLLSLDGNEHDLKTALKCLE